MREMDLHLEKASKVSSVQWRWSTSRAALLALWAFLLGANLVRVAGALDANEPWWGAGLGVAVSAGGIAWLLSAARARRASEEDRRDA